MDSPCVYPIPQGNLNAQACKRNKMHALFKTPQHTYSEFYATLGVQDAHIPHGPLMTHALKTRATESDALRGLLEPQPPPWYGFPQQSLGRGWVQRPGNAARAVDRPLPAYTMALTPK